MIKLKDMNGVEFELDKDSVTCGRTDESDVCFSRDYTPENRPGVLHWVSGKQFGLEMHGEDIFVRDLSRHGTHVKVPGKNYCKVEVPYAIKLKDIRSGDVRIRAGVKHAYELKVLLDSEIGDLN